MAVDVALLVKLGGHRAAVFLGQGDVTLEFDGHRHGDLAQADRPAQHAGQRAGLTVVVEELEYQSLLARLAAQLQTKDLGRGGAADGNLRAFHGSSPVGRYNTRPFSSPPSIRAQTRRQTTTPPGTP